MNRFLRLLEVLEKRYGDMEFFEKDPFRVLITTILSQRTRDENTLAASKNLFKKVRTPEDILKMDIKTLKRLVKPAGMYDQKARKIKEVSKIIVERFGGEVPKTREELMDMLGVGYKTADVVLMYGLGIPSIAIDTHCNRIPKRLGLVPESADVEEVKRILERNIPKEKWWLVNLGLVQFGREICRPVKPRCDVCPLKDMCDFYRRGK